MICPECQFEKWDGKSVHLYGGRESARLNCFGPKRWREVPKKELGPALAKARDDMAAVAQKNRRPIVDESAVVTTQNFETMVAQPPHKAIVASSKRSNRFAALSAAIGELEATGQIRSGAAIADAPRPSGRRPVKKVRRRESKPKPTP